jgi:ADP-ribose pyrophosphatase YjhB (NUDIX family)
MSQDKTVLCRTIECGYRNFPAADVTFRPAAYGLVARGSELLLVFFPKFANYTAPGGGVEPDELLADAVRREVLEETGWEVEVGELVHFAEEFFYHPHTEKPHHCLSFFFLCRPIREAARPDRPDYADARAKWVDVAAPRDDLHPFIREAVEKCRERLLR